MTNYYFFLKKLKEYEPYEIEASKRIENFNNVSTIFRCNTNEYDFKTSDDKTYEVKTDKMSLSTNNFYIEFEGYGKPSGIKTTISDYYIFSDTINYYCIPTIVLKQIIQTCNYRIKDNSFNNAKGYIINKYHIINLSYLI